VEREIGPPKKRRLIKRVPSGTWLNKEQVAEYLGVHPSTIDRYKRDPPSGFPEPYWLTPTNPRWSRDEVEAWVASRPRKCPSNRGARND
jgi:predicted DNA-binding transcriptional regulator AlpA